MSLIIWNSPILLHHSNLFSFHTTQKMSQLHTFRLNPLAYCLKILRLKRNDPQYDFGSHSIKIHKLERTQHILLKSVAQKERCSIRNLNSPIPKRKENYSMTCVTNLQDNFPIQFPISETPKTFTHVKSK